MMNGRSFFISRIASISRQQYLCCMQLMICGKRRRDVDDFVVDRNPTKIPPAYGDTRPRYLATSSSASSSAHRLDRGAKTLRITWIGLWSNVFLSLSKAAAGMQIGSSALIADALHGVSDVAGDVIALTTISLARGEPSITFPYGYGKWEGLGTLAVFTLLIASGIGSAYHSLSKIMYRSPPDSVLESSLQNSEMSHAIDAISAVTTDDSMIFGALAVAGLSVAIKEALFRATVRIGKESRSPVVIANAWHHRQDALTSVASILGILGTYAGYMFVDPVAGVVVSGLIVKAGVDSGIQAVSELTDRVTEDNADIVSKIEQVGRDLSSENKDFVNLHDVRLRRFGGTVLVDVHAVVRPTLSVTAAFHLGQEAKRRIVNTIEEVGDVFVHIDAGEDAFQNVKPSLSFTAKHKARHHIHPSPTRAHDMKHKSEEPIVYSHADIEARILRAVKESNQPIILGMSHCTVHYEDPRLAKTNQGVVPVCVEINIIFDPSISLNEANSAARVVHQNILRTIPFVKSADLHVELNVEDGKKDQDAR